MEDSLSDFLERCRQSLKFLLLVDLNLSQLLLSREQNTFVRLGAFSNPCLSNLHRLPNLHCCPIVTQDEIVARMVHNALSAEPLQTVFAVVSHLLGVVVIASFHQPVVVDVLFESQFRDNIFFFILPFMFKLLERLVMLDRVLNGPFMDRQMVLHRLILAISITFEQRRQVRVAPTHVSRGGVQSRDLALILMRVRQCGRP